MTGIDLAALQQSWRDAGQGHLWNLWDDLDQAQRQQLLEEIQSVDLDVFAEQLRKLDSPQQAAADGPADRAQRATGPGNLVRIPATDGESQRHARAAKQGEQMLRDGRVGAILVAGGQGSRLGFPHPKGMFPVGPISQHTLFQILCEQLLARSRKAGVEIPYFIMTSHVTHAETVAFFDQHDYFGLNRDNVFFFQQGNMPAVDAQTRQILRSGPSGIQLSPDGHGGLLAALAKADLFQIMQDRGIDTLYYHQVDNPTARVCDPAFLGFHAEYESQMSTKVVAKTSPTERMGAVVDVDGQTQIIEYSDLPEELADKRDSEGNPIFWAGSTAIHVFDREFLQQLTANAESLPFHVARKNVPYVDDSGESHDPSDPQHPNALKFERFIFDALPFAEKTLVVEAAREEEFSPVKNATGNDSPETSRSAMLALHAMWLKQAGFEVEDGARIEISPLAALGSDDLRGRDLGPFRADQETFLHPDSVDPQLGD